MPLARMASIWTEILDKIILHSHLASGGFLHCNNKMALIFHRNKKKTFVSKHVASEIQLVLDVLVAIFEIIENWYCLKIYWSKARTIILVE